MTVFRMRPEPEKSSQACACDCMEDEFVVHNFSLDFDDPDAFIRSEWCVFGSKFYLCYRLFMAIGLLIWLPVDVWYITTEFNNDIAYYWFLFATNWALVGITMTAVLHAGLVVYYTARPYALLQDIEKCMLPFSLKFFWINSIICQNACLVISVVYWAAIMVLPHSEMFSSTISQVKHTLLMVYVLFDTFVSAYPVRLFHVVYALLCMSFYVVFNAVYFAAGGVGPGGADFIYYQLQWDHVGESIMTVLLAFMMGIVAQMVLYTVFCMRKAISRCCQVASKSEEVTPILDKDEHDKERGYDSHSPNQGS